MSERADKEGTPTYHLTDFGIVQQHFHHCSTIIKDWTVGKWEKKVEIKLRMYATPEYKPQPSL